MLTQDVWKEFYDKVYGFVRKRVADRNDIKDLVQDIFLKIHMNLHSLNDRRKLGSWS
jgi:RNA polymerase sigma-70 factor (ECF subfamily)